MSNFKGLAHIGLFTEDIEKSKSFYMDKLKFKLDSEAKIDKPDNAWTKIAFINLKGMVIELIEPSDKSKVKSGNEGSVDHLTIEVKNIDDVVNKLKLKGIIFETEEPIIMKSLFKGIRIIFFRGPSGERLELLEFM